MGRRRGPQLRDTRVMFRCLLAALPTLAMWGAERLGQPFTLKDPMAVAAAVAGADKLIGKTIQVKGKATEVCQRMGCWVQLVDPASGQSIRIQVPDGEMVFPSDLAGKTVVAEGVMAKIVLTKQQVIAAERHEAEEQGRKYDPSKVTAGRTVYQIRGNGALILD